MDWQFIQATGAGGIILVLLFVGWLRLGREYDDMKEQRDEWRAVALDNGGTASEAMETLRRHLVENRSG